MEFVDILPYIQIVVSILLIVLILLQQSEAGVGGVFGGGDTSATYRTRRGSEKVIFYITILVAIVFVALTITSIFI